jgi:hypothetical protein
MPITKEQVLGTLKLLDPSVGEDDIAKIDKAYDELSEVVNRYGEHGLAALKLYAAVMPMPEL